MPLNQNKLRCRRPVVASAASGEVSAADRTYLSQLVAARTGLSETDAQARVDGMLASVNDAKVKAQEAADTAPRPVPHSRWLLHFRSPSAHSSRVPQPHWAASSGTTTRWSTCRADETSRVVSVID